MKAVQVVGYHTKLQLTDIPEPKIDGPLDVIVRIGGAGVCRTDIHILEGQWAEKSGVALPYTIGHENAGWVHSVGDAVTNVTVGDKVIMHPLITCGLCRACRLICLHCIHPNACCLAQAPAWSRRAYTRRCPSRSWAIWIRTAFR